MPSALEYCWRLWIGDEAAARKCHAQPMWLYPSRPRGHESDIWTWVGFLKTIWLRLTPFFSFSKKYSINFRSSTYSSVTLIDFMFPTRQWALKACWENCGQKKELSSKNERPDQCFLKLLCSHRGPFSKMLEIASVQAMNLFSGRATNILLRSKIPSQDCLGLF